MGDSVENCSGQVSGETDFVLIHDAVLAVYKPGTD